MLLVVVLSLEFLPKFINPLIRIPDQKQPQKHRKGCQTKAKQQPPRPKIVNIEARKALPLVIVVIGVTEILAGAGLERGMGRNVGAGLAGQP